MLDLSHKTILKVYNSYISYNRYPTNIGIEINSLLIWVPMKKIISLLHNCNVRPVLKALPSLSGFGSVSVTNTRGF